MDIQQQVAARRAELAKQTAIEASERTAQTAREAAAKQAQRDEALDIAAADLSTSDLSIAREGDGLAIVKEIDLPAIDISELKSTERKRLLEREARKAWTPSENWQVIVMITLGVVLLLKPLIGITVLLIGVWRMIAVQKRHRQILIERYAALFGSLTTTK